MQPEKPLQGEAHAPKKKTKSSLPPLPPQIKATTESPQAVTKTPGKESREGRKEGRGINAKVSLKMFFLPGLIGLLQYNH